MNTFFMLFRVTLKVPLQLNLNQVPSFLFGAQGLSFVALSFSLRHGFIESINTPRHPTSAPPEPYLSFVTFPVIFSVPEAQDERVDFRSRAKRPLFPVRWLESVHVSQTPLPAPQG